jgi:hypothetical protein
MSGGAVARQREPWPALIEGPSRRAVLREVGRAMRAGELARAGQIRSLESGRWAVPVYRLKAAPAAPAWRRPVLVATGVVVVLSGAAVVGWWLAAAGPAVGAVAVVLLLLRVAPRPSRGQGCTLTITHRRHR